MERFARLDKAVPFAGRDALKTHLEQGAPNRLVCLEVDAGDADCISSEPVLDGDGAIVGTTTSGGYAHHLAKSLAIAYVKAELATDGRELAVDILGERRPAVVHTEPLYDPSNARLRA